MSSMDGSVDGNPWNKGCEQNSANIVGPFGDDNINL
jgi:hypothetical protein